MLGNTTAFSYGRRIRLLMAVAAAFCAMALVTGCPEADEPPVVVLDLDGDVLDINTSAGLAGVVLHLVPGDYEATTDDSGYWSFEGVPPRSYTLSIDLDGAAFGDCEGELWRNGEGSTNQAYVAGFNFVDGNDWTRGVVHMDGASGIVSFTALAGGDYTLYVPDPESGTVRSKSFMVAAGQALTAAFDIPQPVEETEE